MSECPRLTEAMCLRHNHPVDRPKVRRSSSYFVVRVLFIIAAGTSPKCACFDVKLSCVGLGGDPLSSSQDPHRAFDSLRYVMIQLQGVVSATKTTTKIMY